MQNQKNEKQEAILSRLRNEHELEMRRKIEEAELRCDTIASIHLKKELNKWIKNGRQMITPNPMTAADRIKMASKRLDAVRKNKKNLTESEIKQETERIENYLNNSGGGENGKSEEYLEKI